MHCKEYLFVVSLFSGDDGRISDEREMNSWVWHQICLELIQIHVEGTVESKRCGDGGNDLADQSIQIRISWPLNVQVSTANVVNGLVVNHKCAIGMVQSRMGCQNGIVGFNDSCNINSF